MAESDRELGSGNENPSIRLTKDLVPDDNSELSADDGLGLSPGNSGQSQTFKGNKPDAESIGRYRVLSLLGQGGFGRVLLAEDPVLKRNVAIKIPISERYEANHTWDSFIHEAQAVANLNHEAIIQVFDIDSNEEGLPFVVMELVEGQTLKDLCKKSSMTIVESLNVVREIAKGLSHAHRHSIVHRDLKPSNIMIDLDGRVKIADFGLAFFDNIPRARVAHSVEGTLGYMSPEQLRGENHRLDGRTDIWALGITMYWMFCRELPFQGESIIEFIKEIAMTAPRPIRQINPSVPPDAERVCSKCLRPLMSERYQSAADLVDDLDFLINEMCQSVIQPSESSEPILSNSFESSVSSSNVTNRESTVIAEAKVIPKGLRAFDNHDSEFYPLLLPGPKDRYGIPDTIRFWVHKLLDEESELPIGLIYGPSGCGKTSFVRAGVLPRLGKGIQTAYIECSRHNTEKDIINKLGKFLHLDASVEKLGVMDLFRELRLGNRPLRSKSKILVVLDQFEQWLHENGTAEHDPELIHGLRQCDGSTIQCLILVRDDYWMSAHNFFEKLESPIQNGVNAMAVPLLNERHARKVLKLFGDAYGVFPENDLTRSQVDFLNEAVSSLSDQGKVVCAHLSLFADIAKDRPWTKTELARLGGWEGISFRYFEESFGKDSKLIQYRSERQIVDQLLSLLLPDSDRSIKGASRSRSQLIADCSHLGKATQTERLLDLMDQKLRIITQSDFVGDSKSSEPDYQLAHDTLVQPIKNWLMFQQESTWQGKARVRLGELTKRWVQTGESRNLPGPLEYLRIVFSGNAEKRSVEQRRFLRASHRRYGTIAACTLVLCASVLLLFRMGQNNQLRKDISSMITAFVDAGPDASPNLLRGLLKKDREIATSLLKETDNGKTPREQMRLSILSACLVGDELEFTQLFDELRGARTNECQNFVDAIAAVADAKGLDPVEVLTAKLHASQSNFEKTRLAILLIYFEDAAGIDYCLQHSTNLKTELVFQLTDWHGELKPIANLYPDASSEGHVVICNALADKSPDEHSVHDRQQTIDYLSWIYHDSEVAAIHFAAEHALGKWSSRDSMETIDRGKDFRTVDAVGNTSLSFVEIQPGIVPFGTGDARQVNSADLATLDPTIQNTFWISNQEVGRKLFFAFVDSDECPVEIKDAFENHVLRTIMNKDGKLTDEFDDYAMYGVNWFDAIQFCNWFSKKNGLRPAYKKGGPDKNALYGGWSVDIRANGFRLPDPQRWEWACRGGTETTFSWGNQDLAHLMDKYCWCPTSKNVLIKEAGGGSVLGGRRGTKLPNYFGLFDMLGNVSEWNESSLIPFKDQPNIRGGHALDSLRFFYVANINHVAPHRRDGFVGIRLIIDQFED